MGELYNDKKSLESRKNNNKRKKKPPAVSVAISLQRDMVNQEGKGCCYEPGRGISALYVASQAAIFNHPYVQLL